MEHSRHGSTAIVIMAKPPIAGQVKTRLCPPLTFEQAADLQAAMLMDTINRLETLQEYSLILAIGEDGSVTGSRVKVSPQWTVIPQGSGDLGQRLYYVSKRLIISHERVIFLGADSPTIPLALIKEAVAVLDNPEAIALVGSDDGGYCLLGLTETREELFAGIDWSTDRVMVQTVEKIKSLYLNPVILGDWYDVDDPNSLDRLRQELINDPEAAPLTNRVLAKFFAG